MNPTHRMRLLYRIFMGAFAVALPVLFWVTGVGRSDRMPVFAALVLWSICALLGWLALRVLTGAYQVTESALAYSDVFGERSLRWSDIRSAREVRLRNGWQLQLFTTPRRSGWLDQGALQIVDQVERYDELKAAVLSRAGLSRATPASGLLDRLLCCSVEYQRPGLPA